MTAEQKIEKLINLIRSGRTVRIITALKITRINNKTLMKWEKNGNVLLKAKDNSMFMASGNKFVCIDYCGFKVEA